MASKKRKPGTEQLGFGLGPSLPTSYGSPPLKAPQGFPPDPDSGYGTPKDATSADLDLESFDDYDEKAVHNEIPRLRLVDPPKEVSIIVEATGDKFAVSRLRDGGTTVACVMYTRKELEELIQRSQAALEM